MVVYHMMLIKFGLSVGNPPNILINNDLSYFKVISMLFQRIKQREYSYTHNRIAHETTINRKQSVPFHGEINLTEGD